MNIIWWETPSGKGGTRYVRKNLTLKEVKKWIKKAKHVDPELIKMVWFVVRNDGSVLISGDNRCTK